MAATVELAVTVPMVLVRAQLMVEMVGTVAPAATALWAEPAESAATAVSVAPVAWRVRAATVVRAVLAAQAEALSSAFRLPGQSRLRASMLAVVWAGLAVLQAPAVSAVLAARAEPAARAAWEVRAGMLDWVVLVEPQAWATLATAVWTVRLDSMAPTEPREMAVLAAAVAMARMAASAATAATAPTAVSAVRVEIAGILGSASAAERSPSPAR